MTIGVLKEAFPENRVSLLPEHVLILKNWGTDVVVEDGCGLNTYCSNEQYALAGATVLSRTEIFKNAELLLTINLLNREEYNENSSKILLGLFQPLYNYDQIKELALKGYTVFSIDMLPRTTRAQPMDVLSSQANISGYKAVLLAANLFPRYLPMLMTAAGSIPPAKTLILGAGVAGLQAIATARRLGAIVEVFDTRPAVKEEVMSLGAKFIEVEGAADVTRSGGYAVEQTADFIEKQKLKIAQSAAKSDIIISTAQIPGKKAPILITKAVIEQMKPGTVIIDIAAATGGNTELTENGKTIVHNRVTIVGNSSLPSSMPFDASKLYGKNIINFLRLIIDKDGKLNLNFDDDLVQGTCIVHDGDIKNQKVAALQTFNLQTSSVQ